MKKSKFAPWLKTISAVVVTGSFLIGLTCGVTQGLIGLFYIVVGVSFGFILRIGAEVLEYFEHITKQLDDLYNQNACRVFRRKEEKKRLPCGNLFYLTPFGVCRLD